jgi:hypothetical protein
MPSTAEERPMIRYEWSECGVTPLNYNLDGDPTTALFSIDVRGRVDASGARRANPDCEILVEFVLSSDDGEAYPSFLAAGELRDVIEQIENDQGISLDAPECLKLIRRAVSAGNVAVVRKDLESGDDYGYFLEMSAMDDGGTAVKIRLPPEVAERRGEVVAERERHRGTRNRLEGFGSKLQTKMDAHIAKADAAVAKMRRGAAALREAVRVYDASFDASVAPNQPKSSLRRQGSGLAGISPVKAAPPPSGRRWRVEAIAAAEDMETAVLDAERYAAGEVEWMEELRESRRERGEQKTKDEKNTPDDADEGTGTHVAKKTKRGLQLAADVNTN